MWRGRYRNVAKHYEMCKYAPGGPFALGACNFCAKRFKPYELKAHVPVLHCPNTERELQTIATPAYQF